MLFNPVQQLIKLQK